MRVYVLQVLLKFTCGRVVGWVCTLPSVLLRMVVMCALHLAIFLEICGAVAFLHSLLMSEIVVFDKFADAILVFLLLRGDSLHLRYLRCFATSSIKV